LVPTFVKGGQKIGVGVLLKKCHSKNRAGRDLGDYKTYWGTT